MKNAAEWCYTPGMDDDDFHDWMALAESRIDGRPVIRISEDFDLLPKEKRRELLLAWAEEIATAAVHEALGGKDMDDYDYQSVEVH